MVQNLTHIFSASSPHKIPTEIVSLEAGLALVDRQLGGYSKASSKNHSRKRNLYDMVEYEKAVFNDIKIDIFNRVRR